MSNEQRLNEYSNSMFRYEHLSERWIDSCTAYVRALFGAELRGRTVIDYACGRGNWSLAFLAAGAERVVAIDASTDIVARFRGYCTEHNIRNIEVLSGNVMDQDFAVRGDLVWVYGILPNIADQTTFLRRMKTLCSGPAAQIYVYQYNARSLREFTVQTCRSILVYQSESEFRQDNFLFVRPARMRARDDLTAPTVTFSTAANMRSLFQSVGLYVKRRDIDFQQFLHGKMTEDFYPHQFLCSLQPEDEVDIEEPPVAYAEEVAALNEIAQAALALSLTPRERKNIAIGLYNTHFAFIRDGFYAYDSMIEIFQFLLFILLQGGAQVQTLPPAVAAYYKLFHAALAGIERVHRLSLVSEEIADNQLTEYLINNNLRS
ncbi:MAG TPA: class I SAM-dependent methyltransferase [Pyrinomonadaceae bacterium]|nr:class I SAM-dependent methyltransferase [Pyrinomonadaceae bacterium]